MQGRSQIFFTNLGVVFLMKSIFSRVQSKVTVLGSDVTSMERHRHDKVMISYISSKLV